MRVIDAGDMPRREAHLPTSRSLIFAVMDGDKLIDEYDMIGEALRCKREHKGSVIKHIWNEKGKR